MPRAISTRADDRPEPALNGEHAGRYYNHLLRVEDYGLHGSVEDPNTFAFYEDWVSRPSREQRVIFPHLREFSNSK